MSGEPAVAATTAREDLRGMNVGLLLKAELVDGRADVVGCACARTGRERADEHERERERERGQPVAARTLSIDHRKPSPTQSL